MMTTPPWPAIAGFAFASLTPVPLLALGAVQGGPWIWLALGYITVFAAAMDRLAGPAATAAGSEAEFPGSAVLLTMLAVAHLALMPLAVWAIAGAGPLSLTERIAASFAFGLFFGQVSNPVGHELIHRGERRLYRLGVAVYVTLLFGHHASAHRHVHHAHVGSAADPNTARRGESFYAFAPRAWSGSFRAGFAAENARRRAGPHPYAVYIGGAALCCLAALGIAGVEGLAVYVGLALYATALLLLSDYVQHYGLTRKRLPDGRLEPVTARHSWNAAPAFSAALMLNAPLHSDHHAHPTRPFPSLGLPADAPLLPRSLPVMASVALIPTLWRKIMHPRLDRLAAISRERDSAGAGAERPDLAGLSHP